MASINELIAELALAYPKFFHDLGAERAKLTVRLYASKLCDISQDVLTEVVHEIINTEKWFPTIAEIREHVAEHILALPNETQALKQIDARMADRNAPALHPLVNETLYNVGGYGAFRMTEGAIIRGQFGRLYREERARLIRHLQANSMALGEVKPPAELPRSRHGVS